MPDLVCDIVNPGARRAVAFFHGFLGDKNEFRAVGRHFERTHTVLYIDLPGHGASKIEAGTPNSFDAIAQQIATLLEAHGTRWHLVGYSLGGRLALYLGCKRPDLVSHLTLLSTSPGIASATERRAREFADIQLGKALGRNTMSTFLEHWYRQPLFQKMRRHPHFLPMLKRRMQGDKVQIKRSLEALSVGKQPSLWQELARLRMPTTVVCGADDKKFVGIGEKMKARNPQIQLEVVAQAGHVVHWEAPKRVIEVIQNVDSRMENRSPI